MYACIKGALDSTRSQPTPFIHVHTHTYTRKIHRAPPYHFLHSNTPTQHQPTQPTQPNQHSTDQPCLFGTPTVLVRTAAAVVAGAAGAAAGAAVVATESPSLSA